MHAMSLQGEFRTDLTRGSMESHPALRRHVRPWLEIGWAEAWIAMVRAKRVPVEGPNQDRLCQAGAREQDPRVWHKGESKGG